MKTKRTALTVTEQICLRAYVSAPDLLDECYRLCHKPKSELYLHKLALRWINNDLQREFLKDLTAVKHSHESQTDDTEVYIDFSEKNNVISALSRSANLEKDNVRRAKILSQIADLQRMKQEENRTDAKLVHFFLPLNCKRCSLYVASQRKKMNEQQPDKKS
jgi:hypothetical protein